MTPEEQRIAIAEAVGWRAAQWSPPNASWYVYDPQGNRHSDPSTGTIESAFAIHAPDYLNDLNTCAHFEATLTADQTYAYQTILCEIVKRDSSCPKKHEQTGVPPASCWTWHATAAQRAEAFLRTIGKWID